MKPGRVLGVVAALPVITAVSVTVYVHAYFWGHRALVAPVPPPPPPLDAARLAPSVDHFHEHGFMIVRDFAPPEWVDFLRATVDDRMAHPHLFCLPGSYIARQFIYHQMNSWMSTDGIFEWFRQGGSAIHAVAQSISPTFASSIRLSHETIDLYPLFHDSFLPIHDDCVPTGKCSKHLQLRYYVALDYIEAGASLNYIANSTKREDPSWASTESKWKDRFIPVPELHPGDVLVWDMTKLHTAFPSIRRVLTFSVMSGEEPLVEGTGMAWVGLFDPQVWEKNDSVFYPMIYPHVPDAVAEARKTMTGHPTPWQMFDYAKRALYVKRKGCRSIFFSRCEAGGGSDNPGLRMAVSVWRVAEKVMGALSLGSSAPAS